MESDVEREQVRATFALGLMAALVALRVVLFDKGMDFTLIVGQLEVGIDFIFFLIDSTLLAWGIYAFLMVVGYSTFLGSDEKRFVRYLGNTVMLADLALIGFLCLVIYMVAFYPHSYGLFCLVFFAILYSLLRSSTLRFSNLKKYYRLPSLMQIFVIVTAVSLSLSFIYFLMPIFSATLNQSPLIPRLSITRSIIFGILGSISLLGRLVYKIHLNRNEQSKQEADIGC